MSGAWRGVARSRRLAWLLAVLAVLLAAVLAASNQATSAELFTSLEAPPTPAEVAAAVRDGVHTFEFDLDAAGAEAAIAAVKAAGGRVTAYHIGGGGGRAWGSVKAGEWVRRYDEPKDFIALTRDVERLVALGADTIHFDNTHRMSGRRLESIADAIVAGGARFVAKNNADKWRLAMTRRPNLRPAYAIVEDAMFDADETQAAAELHAMGVSVYVVGFKATIDGKGQPVTDAYAASYAAANPWAKVLLMEDERAFDSRTGTWVR